MSDGLEVQIRQEDRRLGRSIRHDPRSRGFAHPTVVDRATWRSRTVRLYDPRPNPGQTVGNCTGCAKSMQLNAAGNRTAGVVLGMDTADQLYSLASQLDPWPGAYPPTDTGSSGLASAQAAQQLSLGGEYRWLFGGADQIVQAVVDGQAVSVGTWWYSEMFQRDAARRVEPSGAKVGGHQWIARAYNADADLVGGRCWWGPGWRDFWIRRAHLADLLADNGDAHLQDRATA